MAWIDDEWWQSTERQAALSAGRTLYWFATLIAAVIVVFVAGDVFISWAQGAPIVRIVALIAALAVWLIGCICRAVLP
jgi:hypothetical protein